MTVKLDWVRLPTAWIAENGLKAFAHPKGAGSSETAALMVLIAIAHHADQETGVARITYNQLTKALSVSRTMVAEGLDILEKRNIVTRGADGRSSFKLVGFNPASGWAILPARRLYSGDEIAAFKEFHLRKPTELDALKLYLLFVAQRDREQNRAFVSYPKMEEKTGIKTNRIRAALSLLTIHHLVYTEQTGRGDALGVVQSYRLPQIESRRHGGTTGRQQMDDILQAGAASSTADIPF